MRKEMFWLDACQDGFVGRSVRGWGMTPSDSETPCINPAISSPFTLLLANSSTKGVQAPSTGLRDTTAFDSSSQCLDPFQFLTISWIH